MLCVFVVECMEVDVVVVLYVFEVDLVDCVVCMLLCFVY